MLESRFVVQLHDATRLHYDLRIESAGVFRSWAVPNEGPAEIVRDEPGHLSVRLHGSKLSGGFGLTRTGDRRWILVKVRDEHAAPGTDIAEQRPDSVRSGRTWREVAGRV